jgi:hypothetical protein
LYGSASLELSELLDLSDNLLSDDELIGVEFLEASSALLRVYSADDFHHLSELIVIVVNGLLMNRGEQCGDGISGSAVYAVDPRQALDDHIPRTICSVYKAEALPPLIIDTLTIFSGEYVVCVWVFGLMVRAIVRRSLFIHSVEGGELTMKEVTAWDERGYGGNMFHVGKPILYFSTTFIGRGRCLWPHPVYQ